ncbi:DUF1534 domain-containing protein [Pseudomonas syringae UB303]|uniref:DUF1534 domain-containing protein n=1 Tax=Pseudomonas syringae UB303 TaxID=1357287 RepID=A0AAJ4B3Q7_PSESX|nr:DUF1534 domain-containing protein [Pseudomonas syringae UB303]
MIVPTLQRGNAVLDAPRPFRSTRRSADSWRRASKTFPLEYEERPSHPQTNESSSENMSPPSSKLSSAVYC